MSIKKEPDDGVVAAKEEEEEVATDISSENEGQSDWFPEVAQENLKKLPLDTNESCTNDAAMEICTRDIASIDVHVKKDPVEDVGQEGLSEPLPKEPENCGKDELARQRLNFSSDEGSNQLDELASSEGEKKVPDEPPEEENKNGGTRTDAEIIAVLFLLLLECTLLARDFMAMK